MKYQPNLWSFIPSRPINDKMWLNKPVKWPIIYVIQQREQERAPHTHKKKIIIIMKLWDWIIIFFYKQMSTGYGTSNISKPEPVTWLFHIHPTYVQWQTRNSMQYTH